MSSTQEHQETDSPRNDSVFDSKDEIDNALLHKPDETEPPPAKRTDDGDYDFTDRLAALRLQKAAFRQKIASETMGKEKVVDKPSNENTNPELASDTTSSPEPGYLGSVYPRMEKGQEAIGISKSVEEEVPHEIKDNDNATLKITTMMLETAPKPQDASNASLKTDRDAAASRKDNTTTAGAVPADDETDPPRLIAYIKLHNDMMAAKSALTTTADEQARLYNHASHVARKLLMSNTKYSDLPLVMHAHACLVLGCSDEDDCFEKMEEALILVKQAVEQGLLGEKEEAEMVRSCEIVMGTRGQVVGDGDGSGSEASESDGEDGGEGGKEVFELP